jgi:hypothetical protein
MGRNGHVLGCPLAGMTIVCVPAMACTVLGMVYPCSEVAMGWAGISSAGHGLNLPCADLAMDWAVLVLTWA